MTCAVQADSWVHLDVLETQPTQSDASDLALSTVECKKTPNSIIPSTNDALDLTLSPQTVPAHCSTFDLKAMSTDKASESRIENEDEHTKAGITGRVLNSIGLLQTSADQPKRLEGSVSLIVLCPIHNPVS